MGIVFEAEDSRLGRRVAVKVMKPDAARERGRPAALPAQGAGGGGRGT